MTPLQPNNKCLTSVATGECLFVAKARADLGVGPGGPASPPPPLLSGIFFFCKRVSDVQYGIQAFAKFKRPECTRLHLRELSENFPGGACAYPGCQRLLSHARKTSGTQGSMRPKLPTKVHRSQSWWALSRPYCHCILYHKILRTPLWSVPFQNQKRLLLNSTKFEPNTLFSSSFNSGWLIRLPGSLKLLFIV